MSYTATRRSAAICMTTSALWSAQTSPCWMLISWLSLIHILTQQDAWEAAELSGIADDIRNMPMGMSTMISEGSGGISGGQKQRLMIARAIAPKPKILMFDEATSALDNITQKKVSD